MRTITWMVWGFTAMVLFTGTVRGEDLFRLPPIQPTALIVRGQQAGHPSGQPPRQGYLHDTEQDTGNAARINPVPSPDSVPLADVHLDTGSQPVQPVNWLERTGPEPPDVGFEEVYSYEQVPAGQTVCCPGPAWGHRTGLFGELLYMRPRNAEVTYAQQVDGGLPLRAPLAVVDPTYEPGYRFGFSKCLDECNSMVFSYTAVRSNAFDMLDSNPPLAIQKMLIHPLSVNAATPALTASASYSVDFESVDAMFRGVLLANNSTVINYSAGLRYGMLQQDLNVIYTNAGDTDVVNTSVEFDGGGFRLGMDGERHTPRGFLLYWKADASFLAGDFRTSYFQGNTNDPVVVNTSWKAGRVVPVLDLELGAGWQSKCGRCRFTAGYAFSGWFNVVATDEWIDAVRNNHYVGMADTMSFDGLTARAEYRF